MDVAHRVRDSIPHVKARECMQTGYAAISAMQDSTPDIQVVGLAMALGIICERAGLDVRTVLQAAERVIADADTFYTTEVRALRAYVDGEISTWSDSSVRQDISAMLVPGGAKGVV